MKVNYKEIFRLKVMLDNENIPYEFFDRSLVMDYMLKEPSYQIIVYEPNQYDLLPDLEYYADCLFDDSQQLLLIEIMGGKDE